MYRKRVFSGRRKEKRKNAERCKTDILTIKPEKSFSFNDNMDGQGGKK